jgi:hypothetical protein
MTIISKEESMRILENDLRRAALEEHSVELEEANVDKRAEILAALEREVLGENSPGRCHAL